jgi:hypothetical protein
MPRSTPRHRPSGQRRSRGRGQRIAREYEGGHGAPYSPVSSETAAPDSPAVDEMKSRDRQDGKADKRRERRGKPGRAAGPAEPENSPDGGADHAAPGGNALPSGRKQRRSHRTLH